MKRILFLVNLILLVNHQILEAQNSSAFSFDIKKPKNVEDKKLPSEKTGDKKFTLPRRVYQNTVTHYNWYFNGKEKLNEILAKAKDAHKDDYMQLLEFYNYTIEQTAKDSIELDSVIIKANSGILLHDLRNDWIDNLYLLMGKAYFFKGIYDTAFLNLQYINYAFSPKEKDGYDKLIGSNANEGGNAFSISSPETKNIFKKMISNKPSRNESFIWQIRTFLAREEYAEAASMIETLKNDPLFPRRLQNAVSEMQALFFYQQSIYDSAARHLQEALPGATNREEKARWEYLIGQLYELSARPAMARDFFEQSAKHTLNPVMEVYARLNMIRQNKGDDKAVTENIASLIRMARKDRYTNYKDIIYYAAAQMELERNNLEGAKALLLKSTQSTSETAADPSQKSKSFLQLGDLTFNEGNYIDAKRFYDSVQMMDIVPDKEKFERRKGVLTSMAENAAVIQRQDSLQQLAGMPVAERDVLLKKMAKKLRKLEGLKEEEELYIPVNTTTAAPAPAPELSDNAKGDWYFYNTSLRSKGYNEFRTTWGNRPNVDNWRRSNAVAKAMQQQFNSPEAINAKNASEEKEGQGTTYESLLMGLPLTPEKLKISNDSIAKAQLEIGRSLMEGLEDYATAIKTIEEYRNRFPDHASMPKALLDLYYCYQKLGMLAEAEAIKKLLEEKYKESEQAGLVNAAASPNKGTSPTDEMTRRYEKIYTLFIEGQFEAAMAEKKSADQQFKNNYWTPQLLYIQSIYLIKERQDESALSVLGDLIKLFPGTVLAGKAERLMEVLGRRQEIERYLRDLKVDRPIEEKVTIIDDSPALVQKPVDPPPAEKITSPPVTAVPKANENALSQPVNKDSIKKEVFKAPTITNPPVMPPPADSLTALDQKKTEPADTTKLAPVQNEPAEIKQIVLPPTTDSVKATENKQLKTTDTLAAVPILKEPVDNKQIVTPPSADSITIADNKQVKTKEPPVPPSKDSISAQNNTLPKQVMKEPVKPTDSFASKPENTVKDTIARKPVTAPVAPRDSVTVVKKEIPPTPVPAPVPAIQKLVNGLFVQDAESSHTVLIVLDKVDRIFVNEARNAFSRYNTQYPATRNLETIVEQLNDNIKLMVIRPFENAVQANAYIQRVQNVASTELIPWLPKDKYYFIISNFKNLDAIKNLKSVSEYMNSLKELYPGQ